MKTVVPTLDYEAYVTAWEAVARAGLRETMLDTWVAGQRYLSLATLALTPPESAQLRALTPRFAHLLDVAVDGILADSDWWSALAWPWPAIELARQEPAHPSATMGARGSASLYGRFDCLLDSQGNWQVIEYNADTPSGGREASCLEPAIARLSPPLRRLSRGPASRFVVAIQRRIAQHARPVRCIGVVSAHSWLEDMAQATWLAYHLNKAGLPTLVGDVSDLAERGSHITLRGQPIDALYRFYPVERLYRHAIFASLCEAAIERRLLALNGLRSFLAQSKVCLAWLWAHRASLDASARPTIERHLPATVLARDPHARALLADGVIKHVNGREGDSVVFGAALTEPDPGWEARLLEGGYVVQRAVHSQVVQDVRVDDLRRRIEPQPDRFACVGAFAIGGRFGGCYTRLDGPITTARAKYVATLCQRS